MFKREIYRVLVVCEPFFCIIALIPDHIFHFQFSISVLHLRFNSLRYTGVQRKQFVGSESMSFRAKDVYARNSCTSADDQETSFDLSKTLSVQSSNGVCDTCLKSFA